MLALALCFGTTSGALAGDFRVATVDMATLFKEYPGTVPAQKKFNEFILQKKQSLADSEGILEDLKEGLKGRLSAREKRRKLKALAEATRDYQSEKDRILDELDERDREMTVQLVGRIKDIVAREAREKGLDLVLDSDIVAFNDGGADLTDDMVGKFDKQGNGAQGTDSDGN